MGLVDMNNKTILVTGAAGFIGSNLVKRICEENPSAIVIGIGAVVQSALYKPLAEKRQDDVSKIISSANKFFTRLKEII